MPDIIDDAQAREAQYLAVCLSHARASQPAGPQERDAAGRVICAECGETVPAYDAEGGLIGTETRTVAAHQEVLRMPANWDAVAQYVAYVAARGAEPGRVAMPDIIGSTYSAPA